LFDDFVNYHAAKGSKFKDWSRAYNTWVSNAKKYGETITAPKVITLSKGEAYLSFDETEAAYEDLAIVKVAATNKHIEDEQSEDAQMAQQVASLAGCAFRRVS